MESGSCHPSTIEVLKAWDNFIRDEFPIDLDYIIYLRTTPRVVLERIKIRQRTEENSITLQYLQNIHKLHEAWINALIEDDKIKIIVLNGDVSVDDLKYEFLKIIDQIQN